MKKATKSVLVSLLAILLIFLNTALPARGGDGSEIPLKEQFPKSDAAFDGEKSEEASYLSAMEEYRKKNYPAGSGEVLLRPEHSGADPSLLVTPSPGNGGKALLWDEKLPELSYSFHVEAAGLYEIHVNYLLSEDGGNPARRGLAIDGRPPFSEASGLTFDRFYEDGEEPRRTRAGDEIKPAQKEILVWRETALTDNQGLYDLPFAFYFSEGTHVLTLTFHDQPMYLGNIRVAPPKNIVSYREYRESVGQTGGESAFVEYQAETSVKERNNTTIAREYDPDPSTVPGEIGYVRLNTVGGYAWRTGNQEVTFRFTVPKDGLYKLGMRLNQSYLDGLPGYRQILIDGEIPFSEFISYEIPYSTKWQMHTFSDKAGTPFYLHFKTGREYSLTMRVKTQALTPLLLSLQEDSFKVSQIVREIVKITGNTPDPNYDYELDKQIPELTDRLGELRDSFRAHAKALKKSASKTPGVVNAFGGIVTQLERLCANPSVIPKKLNDLRGIQDSASSYYNSLRELPLAIDFFALATEDQAFTAPKAGIFTRIWAFFKPFFISFTKNYESVGEENTDAPATLDVWITRGRDWAELTKRLSDMDFVQEKGIDVRMNILPASQFEANGVNALMLSIVSGKAPDVCLGVGSTLPVEYAIRSAVLDLDQFPDYQAVSGRFLKAALVPFEYKGKTYALPETMDFKALFFRSDILSELNLKIPDTWDEIYGTVLPALYQNSMQLFVPIDFTTFLFQNGGAFYTADGLRSGLDSPDAFRAFREFTQLYTDMGIPVSANFYMRMRTGEIPMGVGGFAEYMTFMVAAPELAGKWSIAPVPGHRKADGTVDRSVGGVTGTGCIILSETAYPKEAWEFLKWWTGAKTQRDFSRDIESVIGMSARWNSANIEAFKGLPWSQPEMATIEEMWKWAKETPVVLGGYFTGRHIGNAWNRVVLSDYSPRDSLEQAVDDINRELRAKQQEYHTVPN